MSKPPTQIAEAFHEIYERLAPEFGYETRKETRKFDPTTPNGQLMIAVCAEIQRTIIQTAIEEAMSQVREIYLMEDHPNKRKRFEEAIGVSGEDSEPEQARSRAAQAGEDFTQAHIEGHNRK